MKDTVLHVENLRVDYDDHPIIRDISFDLPYMTCLMVAGPSGSGKSTLLKTINRLIEPTDGSVYLRGDDVRQISVPALRARIVYVPQSTALGPVPVRENIQLGPAFRGDSITEEKIQSLLSDVGLPTAYLPRNTRTLSGGEQYRLSLAMALSLEPEVLLLDEPTAHLDPELTGHIADMISARIQSGLSAVIVSHDMVLFRRIGREFIFLVHGRIKRRGEIQDAEKDADQEALWRELRALSSSAPTMRVSYEQ